MVENLRQRIVEAAYACVARRGMAKTTVEDVAREAGLSRATVYRAFPGGRDEMIDATVSWAVFDFFAKLYDRIQGAASLEEMMERGIMFAYRSILDHEVLQRVMQTEPDKLLPTLTVESNRIREGIAGVWPPASTWGTQLTSWPAWSCPTCRHRDDGTSRIRSRWRASSALNCWPAWWCQGCPADRQVTTVAGDCR